MDANNQLQIFFACILVGFLGGVLYEIFGVFRRIFGYRRKRKTAIYAVFDILYFLTFAVFCIFSAVLLHFPAFRVYMLVGYAVGEIIYLKTLRIILAFLINICYNSLAKVVKRFKKARKNS